MILIQQDNLFQNIQMVRAASLKVPLYTCAEYNQRFARDEDWPGQRSDLLSESAPELNDVVHRAVNSIPFFQQLKFHTFVHFRGAESEDWIHQDHEPLAGIIYINPTNVESGTRIYNQQKQMITDCKYVQNRLVMYSGGHLHQGYGHFGTEPINGRTTINLFLKTSD